MVRVEDFCIYWSVQFLADHFRAYFPSSRSTWSRSCSAKECQDSQDLGLGLSVRLGQALFEAGSSIVVLPLIILISASKESIHMTNYVSWRNNWPPTFWSKRVNHETDPAIMSRRQPPFIPAGAVISALAICLIFSPKFGTLGLCKAWEFKSFYSQLPMFKLGHCKRRKPSFAEILCCQGAKWTTALILLGKAGRQVPWAPTRPRTVGLLGRKGA